MTSLKLESIPLDKIDESPWNPRKHFDALEQANLTASMEAHGQLVPGTLRPRPEGRYELAAGTRRFRSAKALGLETYLAIVRELTDAEFCEILAIENDERSDVHPLEQANGFKLLMEHSGYDVAKIATRIQRSHEFVHDRMRLLQLIPALKEQFLENRFLLAHAIILARLTDEQQARAMSTKRMHAGMSAQEGGLYRSDLTLDKKLFPYVARSPGELQEWVNDNCRFVPDAVQLEEDFPETAVLLEAAEETGTKVVYITDGYMVSQGARDVNEKTIPARSWKRADGELESKYCDRAVIGIYADGDRRGQSIGVCVSKTSCLVHWASDVKRRKAREAKKAKSGATPKSATKRAPALKPFTPQQIKAKRTMSLRVAAAKPMEAALRSAHLKPSRQLIAAAKAWVAKDMHVKGSLSADQLLVAKFAGRFGNLEWVLRERLKELEIFGVDAVLRSIKVDTCIYCGCGELNACDLGYDPKLYRSRRCAWISNAPFVCSNPRCVKQHEKAGGKVDEKGKAALASAAVEDDAEFDDED